MARRALPPPCSTARAEDGTVHDLQDERAVYHDDIKDYSTNEPTMDGTASAILLWALHLPPGA